MSLFRHACQIEVNSRLVCIYSEREAIRGEYPNRSAWPENCSPVVVSELMGARIARRLIIAIRVISWAAIMIVMGLIASVIVASIYQLFYVTN
jgi:hypothetical protein